MSNTASTANVRLNKFLILLERRTGMETMLQQRPIAATAKREITSTQSLTDSTDSCKTNLKKYFPFTVSLKLAMLHQLLLLFYQLFIRHLLRHWTICPWGGEADVDIGSSIKTNRIVGYVAVVLLQAANLPLL